MKMVVRGASARSGPVLVGVFLALSVVSGAAAGATGATGEGTASGGSAGSAGSSAPIPVVVDIRPGLCPNHLRTESAGTLPVAILGTEDLDVTNIDPGTIRLSRDGYVGQSVPASWAYADVGFPVIGSSPDCNDPRGDGLDDLVVRFPLADVVAQLGLGEYVGQTVRLTLTGAIVTGQAVTGGDDAVVLRGPWPENGDPGSEVGMVAFGRGEPAAEFKFAYYTNTSDRIVFAVYDARGRMVARLVNMDMAPGIYNVTWNGQGMDGANLPSGPYFARVSNSLTGETRKLTLLH